MFLLLNAAEILFSVPTWPTPASPSQNVLNSTHISVHAKRCKASLAWGLDEAVDNIPDSRAFRWLGPPQVRVQQAMRGGKLLRPRLAALGLQIQMA